jgi:hypothetical protein
LVIQPFTESQVWKLLEPFFFSWNCILEKNDSFSWLKKIGTILFSSLDAIG